MKNKILLPIFVISAVTISAQQSATLDINNIQAEFNSAGDHLCTDTTLANTMQTPANGVSFSVGQLWIGGFDQSHNLYVAAQTYRQTGTDFWAGAIDTASEHISTPRNAYYNRVWKINKTTIDSFRLGLFSIVPNSIASWPANGDAQFNEARNLAPYADLNGDGFYDPASGDYPLIRGDQAIFFMYNDHLQGSSHTESGSPNYMCIEIHGMAYAVNCPSDSALQNAIFVHYEIYNRSARNYDSVFVALWNDFDIGFGAGRFNCDSAAGTYYHHAGARDAVGVVCLNQPLAYLVGAVNRFVEFNGDLTLNGNPTEPSDYYGFMSGHYRDSSLILYANTGGPTNYMYTGDPNTSTGWLSLPDDYRSIGSSGPYNLNAGSNIAIDYAYVYAHDYGNQGNQGSVIVRNRMNQLKLTYTNDSTNCGNITGIDPAVQNKSEQILLYPNPTSDVLYLQFASAVTFQIFNSTGDLVYSNNMATSQSQITISTLATGLYIIRTSNGSTSRFIKTQ
jgi:Secretion system C-terminal sorting domain